MTQIRYAQCWEDPNTLRRALRVTPDDDVVSIASGGDNTFALLLDNPRSIVAVDSNPAQIFLVELKMRAIQAFDYGDFIVFLGARPSHRRLQLYTHLRPRLSEAARSYWDRHTDDVRRGVIHGGKFERYFSIFRRMVLPLIHSQQNVLKLLAASSDKEQIELYDEVWENRRWRGLFRLFFSRFVLGHLGRDPKCFQYVRGGSIAEDLLRRTRRGLRDIPIVNNYFIEYILTGRYADLEKGHPYLRESNFEYLKQNIERLRLVRDSLQDYLAALPAESISKFNLSDIFEYMSETALAEVVKHILRTCQAGTKLAFWALFIPRFVPAHFASQLEAATRRAEKLFAADRTFFYGSFNLWQTNAPNWECSGRKRENDPSAELMRDGLVCP